MVVWGKTNLFYRRLPAGFFMDGNGVQAMKFFGSSSCFGRSQGATIGALWVLNDQSRWK